MTGRWQNVTAGNVTECGSSERDRNVAESDRVFIRKHGRGFGREHGRTLMGTETETVTESVTRSICTVRRASTGSDRKCQGERDKSGAGSALGVLRECDRNVAGSVL